MHKSNGIRVHKSCDAPRHTGMCISLKFSVSSFAAPMGGFHNVQITQSLADQLQQVCGKAVKAR